MMKMWRRLGIDKLLIKAGHRGTVLAGVSAGAICWHGWGHSDSRAYSGWKNWAYIKVRGLGLRQGLYCPHLNSEKRHASFKAMVAREKMLGIACDDFAAVHYDDSRRNVHNLPEEGAGPYLLPGERKSRDQELQERGEDRRHLSIRNRQLFRFSQSAGF